MTDQDQPSFKVVDRRNAMTENSVSETAREEPHEALSDHMESETLKSHPAEANSEDEPETHDSDTEYSSGENGQESNFPDPAVLLSFVAMQIGLHDLLKTLIPIFDGHAWRSLGLVADPVSGEQKKNMAAAQLAIDTVQFLLGKVESDLPEAERRELLRRLNDLRLNYITQLN